MQKISGVTLCQSGSSNKSKQIRPIYLIKREFMLYFNRLVKQIAVTLHKSSL